LSIGQQDTSAALLSVRVQTLFSIVGIELVQVLVVVIGIRWLLLLFVGVVVNFSALASIVRS
jgi:hypothetical protein